MSDSSPYTDKANVARWRTRLMHKGMEVNGQLTALLARQNATMATLKLPNEMEPGETKEEKLRRYLNQIIAAQRRLGSEGFGKCATCGVQLPVLALDDAPWLEECGACFAQSHSNALPF
ncbi:MAG: hypothetical protein FJ100_21780 [Deltaproteobacteria bacterium]|nr:hypothetical protein [Deltaproteobacteria bacterium]